jgi:hypothetical protein
MAPDRTPVASAAYTIPYTVTVFQQRHRVTCEPSLQELVQERRRKLPVAGRTQDVCAPAVWCDGLPNCFQRPTPCWTYEHRPFAACVHGLW